MSTLSFTSFIAGNLKDLFDQKFLQYKASLESMQTIAPQQISQQLEGTVDNFFKQIEASIKSVEAQVTERIHASKNLAELEEILSKSENTFGYSDEKVYDKARVEIDEFVKQGQYSSVVGKKEVYEGLIKTMMQQNISMN